MIDFRSDTVTKPTKEMLDAMFNAPVGDDVFSEDPTVNELQEFTADYFGKEAALFCSSGTQTNQIAINVHVQPGGEVICHEQIRRRWNCEKQRCFCSFVERRSWAFNSRRNC
jgi:threonine aldolase